MTFELLHTNQKIFLEELLKRGAAIDVIDVDKEIIKIKYNNRIDYLIDRFSSHISSNALLICADKFLTKSFLKQSNIQTPLGKFFSYDNIENAFEFAKELLKTRTLVLKPVYGSHGDHVFSDIQDIQELSDIIHLFFLKNSQDTQFIIEEFFPWKEYRFFITKEKEFAVIHRQPASIIGDGVHSILELVEQQNKKRILYKQKKRTSLCPIVLDEEVNRFLKKKNLTIYDTPIKDEKIQLRSESNLAKGGLAIDYTQIVDLEIIETAYQILNVFPGMLLAGIDILVSDIKNSQSDYRVLEVNSNPGITMHEYPYVGQAQNVSSMWINVMLKDFFSS